MLSKLTKINIQQFVKSDRDDFTIDGITIKIVRTSRKKTIAVNVRDGSISIIVPQRTSLSQIRAVIADKSKWIQQKLLQQDKHIQRKDYAYIEGESFLFLGKERTLKIVTGTAKRIQIDETSITVSANKTPTPVNIKNRLKKWYQTQAQLYLAQRTKHFAAIMELRPRLVNTRTYSARWGCCSNRKEITYNWQIIMAPERIIDYLIVHELSHIKEHNHSRQFWAQVESVLPDYKERKLYLDNNGQQYQL